MNLFEKFDAVAIDNSTRISEADRRYLDNLQRELDDFANFVRELQKYLAKNPLKNTFYRSELLIGMMEKELLDKTKEFISNVYNHFRKTYNVSLDENVSNKKYSTSVTWRAVVKDILEQLGGYSFEEKAGAEIKEKLIASIGRNRTIETKGYRLLINNFIYIENDYKPDEVKISLSYRETLSKLLTALAHFENAGTEPWYQDFEVIVGFSAVHKSQLLCEHEVSWTTKFKSIRLYKNGKVELKFASSELCQQFAREYCGYTVCLKPESTPSKEPIRKPKLGFQQVVEDILQAHGKLEEFHKGSFYLKLEKTCYMDLVIEQQGTQVFVGHYRIENGDLISDPVLVFERQKGSEVWKPWRIELVFGDTEIFEYDEHNQLVINEKMHAEFVEFSEMYAKNLVNQGWVSAKIKEAA